MCLDEGYKQTRATKKKPFVAYKLFNIDSKTDKISGLLADGTAVKNGLTLRVLFPPEDYKIGGRYRSKWPMPYPMDPVTCQRIPHKTDYKGFHAFRSLRNANKQSMVESRWRTGDKRDVVVMRVELYGKCYTDGDSIAGEYMHIVEMISRYKRD